ncbi:MAG: DUF1614 domain-containing protein [Desulfovibrionaceae bacterium]
MPRGPFNIFHGAAALLVFFLLLVFLFVLIQVGAVTLAFTKLGLSASQGFLLLVLTLIGATINIPVYRTGRLVPVRPKLFTFQLGRGFGPQLQDQGEDSLREQIVAVNVGGCVIPTLLSMLLVSRLDTSGMAESHAHMMVALSVAIVAATTHKLAKPVQGVGIGVPVLLPPIVTALTAIILAPPEIAPHVAYVAGSLGTLLGADVLHLLRRSTMARLDAPVLAIGGAGTFDGIFLTGIIAVLLA